MSSTAATAANHPRISAFVVNEPVYGNPLAPTNRQSTGSASNARSAGTSPRPNA